MDNENSATENVQPIATESGQKSETLTEAATPIESEIKDRSSQVSASHQGDFSKPKTLTEACNTMKEEIKEEAKRLVPDLGHQH